MLTINTAEEINTLSLLYINENYIQKDNDIVQFLKQKVESIYTTTSKEEAQLFCEKHYKVIDLVIVEGSSLYDTISNIRDIDESMPIVLISDFRQKEEIFKLINMKIDQYIQKPYNNSDILNRVIDVVKNIPKKKEHDFLSWHEASHKDQLNLEDRLSEKIHFLSEYNKAIDIGTPICRIDVTGKITFANETFKKILQYDGEKIEDENYFNICQFHNGINEFARLRKQVTVKDSFNASIIYTKRDGTKIYHSCTYVGIHNSEGEIEETLCFHYDHTQEFILNHEIMDTQRELIYTLGEVAESRSNETGAHIQRVASYSEILAKKCGLEKEAEYIKIASTMHDIGKIAIEDSILKKPGRLTSLEFERMKEHSMIGFDIFKNSTKPILKTAALISRDHHEKWDGSGYPQGLKGEDIHIYGRIVAIADVFDALGSERVYKKAWSLEKILKYFKNNRGKHFDPNLVDIFFENLDMFLEVRDCFK